jgi:hypothetical protein
VSIAEDLFKPNAAGLKFNEMSLTRLRTTHRFEKTPKN